MALNYLEESQYRAGLYALQSQVLDGTLRPTIPISHWKVAPKVISALANITDEIYVVLPRGVRPIFKPTLTDPGVTVSTRELVGALKKHHG